MQASRAAEVKGQNRKDSKKSSSRRNGNTKGTNGSKGYTTYSSKSSHENELVFLHSAKLNKGQRKFKVKFSDKPRPRYLRILSKTVITSRLNVILQLIENHIRLTGLEQILIANTHILPF